MMVIVVKLRNKQIGIYALMIIALIGFILIGKHSFKKEEVKEDKVTHKFNILTDDNVFKKANASQVLKKVNSGNALVFMGFEENKQSEYYASILNEVAKSLKIDNITYYDFYADRQENNATYEAIVNKMKNYLQKDDRGKIDFYSPTFFIIKEGKVIYYDDDASRIRANLSEEEYWNDYNRNLKKAYLEAGIKNYLGEI